MKKEDIIKAIEWLEKEKQPLAVLKNLTTKHKNRYEQLEINFETAIKALYIALNDESCCESCDTK